MNYRKDEKWLEAGVKDEMLMMHADSGRFVSLNDTGTFLWAQLAEPCDIDELIQRLCTEFDVTKEQARADVGQWISEMCKQGVIVEDAA